MVEGIPDGPPSAIKGVAARDGSRGVDPDASVGGAVVVVDTTCPPIWSCGARFATGVMGRISECVESILVNNGGA